MKAWRAWLLKSVGAALYGVSLFALLSVILILLLPGAESSLIHKANDEYAPRMVPILLAHEPQLSTLTYDNTAAYCRSKPPGVSMEFGGISDEYACSLIENNYVSNTEELRLRLARELVSAKTGEIMASYGSGLAGIHARLPALVAVLIISLFLSFPFLYFGSRNLVELCFNISALTALFSFIILVLAALAFFLLPSYLISFAKEKATTPLETDLITVSADLVSESVGELLLPPIIIFGFLSLASGLSSASFYYYLAKIKRG
jgi:hypothetical protein